MNARPRILFLTPTFAPAGGTGSLRMVKMIKFLHRQGWEPVVLTRKRDELRYRDDTLLEDLPDSLGVYPVEFSSSRLLSLVRCIRKSRELNRMQPFAGVITSSPEEENHFYGWGTALALSVPWIADLRDPIEGRLPALKRLLLRRADLLLTAWPVDSIVSPAVSNSVPCHWIPNGFDPDEFPSLEKTGQSTKPNTFVHTGSLYRPRQDPMPIFEALRRIRQDQPGLLEGVDFIFSGAILSDNLRKEIEAFLSRHELNRFVDLRPFTTHRDAVSLIREADVGIAFKAEPALPYKFCEYLGGNLHLLSYYPDDSPLAEIVRDEQGITQVSHGRVGKLTSSLRRCLKQTALVQPRESLVSKFSWETIGEKLDTVLREELPQTSR